MGHTDIGGLAHEVAAEEEACADATTFDVLDQFES